MSEALVYLNGRLVPAVEAHLAIFDAGFVMGATITEQTRTFHKQLYRLDEHLDRLFRSLRSARMDMELSPGEVTAISFELVAHNGILVDEEDELGLIHFVTPGEFAPYAGSSGRPPRPGPTVGMHTFPLPFERWAKGMRDGIHVVTPSIRHVPPQCCDPSIKCRSRMHFYLADQEARLVDPAALALLLDLDGNVTETNAANFFLVEGGTIVTPTLKNILPGISRAAVIALAGKLSLSVVERDVQVIDIMNGSEAFLSSTPFCLMPVTRINTAPIADGKPGPVYHRLLNAWSQEVGLDIARQIQDGAARRGARAG